jgi:acetyl-CoA C-acetyltransferase
MHNVSDSTTPVIVSAVRTPIGRYLGGLSSFTAPQLGAMVIREAVSRADVDSNAVEEVLMGQVVQGGAGQAPARQALIHAGLPASIPALTINKVCGSGLKAVMLASQAIKAGDAECTVAGGQESMSSAPHYVYGMRNGVKAGNQTMVDGMIHDGLWDSFGCCHMGEYAEYTADKAGVSRADQDAFAYDSHRKAIAASDAGKFEDEILPVQVPGKGGPTTVGTDESPRRDNTPETLAKLKPAFRKDGGTVTAGNAPGLNDGASALVVTSLAFAKAHGLSPMARVTGYATGGGEPRDLFFAPVVAVRALMEKSGTRIGDYDLIEANEAFAVQALADGRELGWDWDRVNVHGGAVALGHPIGASGARVLTTLLYALRDRRRSSGLATLCLGGGNAVALSVERM